MQFVVRDWYLFLPVCLNMFWLEEPGATAGRVTGEGLFMSVVGRYKLIINSKRKAKHKTVCYMCLCDDDFKVPLLDALPLSTKVSLQYTTGRHREVSSALVTFPKKATWQKRCKTDLFASCSCTLDIHRLHLLPANLYLPYLRLLLLMRKMEVVSEWH
jgi:hypothetical protein